MREADEAKNGPHTRAIRAQIVKETGRAPQKAFHKRRFAKPSRARDAIRTNYDHQSLTHHPTSTNAPTLPAAHNPSTAALTIPPAYPAPSPTGKKPAAVALW